MKRKYIVAIVALILLSGIAFSLHQQTKPPASTGQTTKPSRSPLPKEATITLTKDGFSPQKVTITVGGAVRWINKSGTQQTVNSDTYPTNQLHKELNFGAFNNNSSVVYTFKTPGSYPYHNQFHPEQKGEVIVK